MFPIYHFISTKFKTRNYICYSVTLEEERNFIHVFLLSLPSAFGRDGCCLRTGPLTMSVSLCLRNCKEGRIFFHPQTRLRGSDYIPSPSGHSENLFSYCIPLWVQVLQRCGVSVPTSSSLNPDALLRCLFNPLSLMAKNS